MNLEHAVYHEKLGRKLILLCFMMTWKTKVARKHSSQKCFSLRSRKGVKFIHFSFSRKKKEEKKPRKLISQ